VITYVYFDMQKQCLKGDTAPYCHCCASFNALYHVVTGLWAQGCVLRAAGTESCWVMQKRRAQLLSCASKAKLLLGPGRCCGLGWLACHQGAVTLQLWIRGV